MGVNKQKEFLQYLYKNGESKKADIYNNMPFGYYANWQKHFGELLNRMVKNGSIIRVKTGVYSVKNSHIGNQLSIL